MLYIIIGIRSDGKACDVFTAVESFSAQHITESAQAGIYGEYDRVDTLISCDNHGWAPAIDRGCSRCEAEIVAAQVAFESELPELQGVCDDCEIGDCGACSISSELPDISDKAEMVADMLGWPSEVIDVSDEIAEMACKSCIAAPGCVLVHNEDGFCYPAGQEYDGYSGGCDTCADGTCGYCVTDEVANRHDDPCEGCMYDDMDCHGDPMGPKAACLESELGIRKSHLDVIKERPVRPSNHWFASGVTPAPAARNAVDEYMAEYREHQRMLTLVKEGREMLTQLDILDKAAVAREGQDNMAAFKAAMVEQDDEPEPDAGEAYARSLDPCAADVMIHGNDCLCIACIADLGDDAFLEAMSIDEDGFKLKDLDLAPPCPGVTSGLNFYPDGTDLTVYCDDCGGCKCHACECAKDVPVSFHEWTPTANEYDECIVCGATVATFFPVSDSVIQMRCDIITGECPGPSIDEGEPQPSIEGGLRELLQAAVAAIQEGFPSDDGECPVDCTCWTCTP